jgi:hypothetical protein
MSIGDVGRPDPVELNDDPAVVSGAISLFAALLAVVVVTPFFGFAVPLGLLGLLFIGVGVFGEGSRRWVSLGVTSIFIAILLAGALGATTPLTVVVGGVAMFVAWDVGQHAVTIGEQFGRGVPTRRGEIVHAAASSLVGVLGAGISYGVYVFGTGDQPALAVILMILGVVGLVWALRD